jgi:plasmid stabilization system protein ParE
MNVVWSPRARKNFDRLILFLEGKWEKKVIIKLFDELENTLQLITENPFLFPMISEKKQIRKCVIRRRTILFYKINELEHSIELVLFIDGRVNPLKYSF